MADGETQGVISQTNPPRGMFNGRLDDKGRLKLAVDLQKFLNSFADKNLFVTSVDRRTAQIYPMDVWRENEKILDTYNDDPEVAERYGFTAADLGGNSAVDGQGRVLFNPELRRELKMDGQGLRCYAFRGHIEVLTEAVYEQQKSESAPLARQDAWKMKRAGMR